MANENSKAKKDKKPYFKDFKAELKKVIWPTPKQIVNSTIAVITMVLIVAAIVFVLDVVFETINTHGISNLKKIVSSSENEITDTENEEALEEDENEEDIVDEETTENTIEEVEESIDNTENTEVVE